MAESTNEHHTEPNSVVSEILLSRQYILEVHTDKWKYDEKNRRTLSQF